MNQKRTLSIIFIDEELATKVTVDYKTTAAIEFRTRWRFKQYNVILTKEQSVLTQMKSWFQGESANTI